MTQAIDINATAANPANVIVEFSKTAMLVSLNARCYGAKKEDKKISREVADAHNTSTDSGKYSKNLVPKDSLEPVQKSITALRGFFYENTLPWLDEGIRVLPSANYETFKAGLESLRDDYDVAVRGFTNAWPDIVENARKKLADMFDVRDYPADIRSRFGCTVRFMPIAESGDFRVTMADAERTALQADIAATLGEAQKGATADIYDRLLTAVRAMAAKLSAYKPAVGADKAQGVFRDSLVDNLRDVVALVPRLNFAGDTELVRLCNEIQAELLAVDAPTLRESDSVRADVADKASAISARIAEFMGDGVVS